jgi:hypothetical protein
MGLIKIEKNRRRAGQLHCRPARRMLETENGRQRCQGDQQGHQAQYDLIAAINSRIVCLLAHPGFYLNMVPLRVE